jgi:hypothetical protein
MKVQMLIVKLLHEQYVEQEQAFADAGQGEAQACHLHLFALICTHINAHARVSVCFYCRKERLKQKDLRRRRRRACTRRSVERLNTYVRISELECTVPVVNFLPTVAVFKHVSRKCINSNLTGVPDHARRGCT